MTDPLLTRMWRRLQAVVAPGRLFLTDDAGAMQVAQIRTGPGEVVDGVPVLKHFGLAYRPPADTLGVVLFVGGDRSQGVIIGTNHPASRLKALEPGEVALYDDQGRWIWIKRNSIEIEAGGKPLTISNATTVTIEASTKVVLDTPLVECSGDVVADGISLKTHVHGGVQAGGGVTGAPQ